jgi:hypothetical protein
MVFYHKEKIVKKIEIDPKTFEPLDKKCKFNPLKKTKDEKIKYNCMWYTNSLLDSNKMEIDSRTYEPIDNRVPIIENEYKCNTNSKQIVTKFLFFPLRLKNETRWLETIQIKQQFSCTRWKNVEFIDEKRIIDRTNLLLKDQKWNKY